MKCTNCGKEIRADLNFCTFCGKQIMLPKENLKKQSKFLKLIIPLLIIVIIVITIIILSLDTPTLRKKSTDLNEIILSGVWYEYSFQDAFADEWFFYDDGTCTYEMRGEGGERKYNAEYATYSVIDNKVIIYKDGNETEWEYDSNEDCCWLYFNDEYGSYKFKISHYSETLTQDVLDKTFYKVTDYIVSVA